MLAAHYLLAGCSSKFHGIIAICLKIFGLEVLPA